MHDDSDASAAPLNGGFRDPDVMIARVLFRNRSRDAEPLPPPPLFHRDDYRKAAVCRVDEFAANMLSGEVTAE